MRCQIVCAGTGGQGVILLARILCEAGHREGLPILSAETHGMAMRGGSVVCMVKLGDFASPAILAGRADVLIGLDAAEADRNRHYLKSGGVAVVNVLGVGGASRSEVDALSLARASGSAKNVNVVMVGFAAGLDVLGLKPENLREAVAALSPEKHRVGNLAAFERGFQAGSQ